MTSRPAAEAGFDTSRTGVWQQITELLKYSELLKLLTIKDVKLRYKGSFLGFLWSLINPLLMMGVYYIVFILLLPVPVQENCNEEFDALCKTYKHYAPFILIGVLAWNFTAGSIISGMNSILGNASIEKKVYFPREILPISSVLAQLVNFLLALVPLFLIILISGLALNQYVLLLPVILISHALFLAGLSMILSIAALYFRDLIVIMEVILQAWFFLSPVIYSMNQVFKGSANLVYWLNPMASYIESYRTILFFGYPPGLDFTIRTCFTGVITFVIGYVLFMWKRKRIGEFL